MKITIERNGKYATHTVDIENEYDLGQLLNDFYTTYKLLHDSETELFDIKAKIHYTNYLLDQEENNGN